MLVRVLAGRNDTPSAVIVDRRTIQSTPERGGRGGYDGVKKRTGSKAHAAVERSFGWAARFRRLARDYEHLASPLAG